MSASKSKFSKKTKWPGLVVVIVASVMPILILSSCHPRREAAGPQSQPLFTSNPPADPSLREEMGYMRSISRITASQEERINEKVKAASSALSIPTGILWCVLFQESRLDRLMNAFNDKSAKGIGQFTPIALEELNQDTNLYDDRTLGFLEGQIGHAPLPISFAIRERKGASEVAPRTSYFMLDTGIASTAVYLNNRYRHLLRTMERRNLEHDPDVVWLLAAAAYNKGPRAINVFLHRLGQVKGERRLRSVLLDSEELIDELSSPRGLHRYFYFLWEKARRKDYVVEMAANIKAVSRCALHVEGEGS